MPVEDQVRALIQAGKQAEAVALVEREAEAGDNWSRFCLAQWKLQGQGVPVDVSGAVGWLERAAADGSGPAKMALISLHATGTGTPEAPERARELLDSLRSYGGFVEAQLRVLERVGEPQDVKVEDLNDTPAIRLYRGVLDKIETSALRSLAQPMLKPSFVIDPATGRRIPHPIRTSDGMSFGPTSENLVVNRINRRIARLTGTPYACGEPLHVLRYTPGQEYRPHLDALPGVTNQRQLTAIVFLNEDFSGGETTFSKLDLSVRAKEGDMLTFANIDAAGAAEPASEHQGRPVENGIKWIATRWIRQQRYHPWEPETAR